MTMKNKIGDLRTHNLFYTLSSLFTTTLSNASLHDGPPRPPVRLTPVGPV